MRKETRVNLIFLAVFLGVSLPGAFILVKKKSDPLAGRMSLPDSVRRRLPYMSPLHAPGDAVTRYVPPLTGLWVSKVSREQGGVEEIFLRKWRPVVSDDRIVQFIGARRAATDATLFFIAWDTPYKADASKYFVTAELGDHALPARVTAARPLELPRDARRELQNGGFVQVPAHVTWLEVTVADPLTAQSPLTLHISHAGAPAAASTVNVFTNEDFEPK
jgi:hypothetical protein